MRGIVFRLLFAIPAGLAALALHGIFGLVHWYTWGAYLVIGLSLSLFGWGGDLLRRSLTDRPAIKIGGFNIHQRDGGQVGPTRSFAGVLSALPFWFLTGGWGYTTGMLISKKILLIGFYYIPVRPIFLVGGILGCVLHLIVHSNKFWKIFGGAYDAR